MPANRYRRKPVLVDAMRWDGNNTMEVLGWTSKDRAANDPVVTVNEYRGEQYLAVETIHGRLNAQRGDWIVRRTKHDWRVYRPEMFAAMYELDQYVGG